MTSTYLSYLTFERTFGRPIEPRSTDTIDPNGDIARETEYFRANIGKVSSGTELARDNRLYQYAVTAFGLTDQIDNRELIVSVLNEGIFDPFVRGNARPNNINDLARAFWFGEDNVSGPEIDIRIASISSRYRLTFETVTQAVNDEVQYFEDTIKTITSGEELVRNERLFRFALQTYSLNDQIGNEQLIANALDAGGYNPFAGQVKVDAPANSLIDSRFRVFAQGFAFNEVGDQNVRNTEFVDAVVNRYQNERLRLEARDIQAASSRRGATLQPNEEREIAYFTENIATISSAEELLDDERLYRFVLRAYDLESQIPFRALIRKVIDEGVEDPDALANTLVDQKFRTLAGDLGFAEVGGRNVRNPNFVQKLVDQFKRVSLESNAGETNIGVRLAAYFDRKGPEITSWFSILGDRALREVVFTAFDFPDAMQQTNPDRLVQILESRMDIEDFQDPVERQKFIQRFTLLYDIRNGAPGLVSNTLTLFGIDPTLDAGAGNGIVSIDPATLGATLF
ncbi:MAG: DUF1217 domain-containing protein [Pseudomonadota bacterium]